MTVRILSDAQKDLVVNFYVNEHFPIHRIANGFNVSERTIGRVLDERGYPVIPNKPACIPYTEQTELDLKFTPKVSWWAKLKNKIINWVVNGEFKYKQHVGWETNEFISHNG